MHTISHPSISYTLHRRFTPPVFVGSAWTYPSVVPSVHSWSVSHPLLRPHRASLSHIMQTHAFVPVFGWMCMQLLVSQLPDKMEKHRLPPLPCEERESISPACDGPFPSVGSLLPSRSCFPTAGPIGPPPQPGFEPELPSLRIGSSFSFRLGPPPPFEPTGRVCGGPRRRTLRRQLARLAPLRLRTRGKVDDPNERASYEGTMRAARCIADAKVSDPHRRHTKELKDDGWTETHVRHANVVLTTHKWTRAGASGKKHHHQNRTCQLWSCWCLASAMHREERTGRPRGRKIRTLQKRRCIGVECDLGRHRRHRRGRRKGGPAWFRYV